MTDKPERGDAPLFNIAAVERETRIGKDTLRAWERRYGFPRPERDANGERLYPLEQVEQLRDVRRLLDAGHRPGRVVPLDRLARQRLGRSVPAAGVRAAGAAGSADDPASDDAVAQLLHVVRSHDTARLRAVLQRALLRHGLAQFVVGTALPLLYAVGEAWAGGELAVFEEHLCSDVLESTLRAALASVAEPPAGSRPRVLVATVQGEVHGLAPLMAAALFAVEGCVCTLLGCETPSSDLVRAAAAVRADVISLSFSAARTAPQVTRSLVELRAMLPSTTEIWAGSPHAAVQRRGVDGVLVLDRLERIGTQVAQWRLSASPQRRGPTA